MPLGPGKYDDALTETLKGLEAEEGVLIVFNAKESAYFSIQAGFMNRIILPQLLEQLASHIRQDLVRIQEEIAIKEPK